MSEHHYLVIRGQVSDAFGYVTYATVVKAGNRVIKYHWNRIIARRTGVRQRPLWAPFPASGGPKNPLRKRVPFRRPQPEGPVLLRHDDRSGIGVAGDERWASGPPRSHRSRACQNASFSRKSVILLSCRHTPMANGLGKSLGQNTIIVSNPIGGGSQYASDESVRLQIPRRCG